MTKSLIEIMIAIVIFLISKSNEKEEYTDTIPREDGSPAERLSEYGLWKVAFELKNQESQRRWHKFFRIVSVKGQEIYSRN